MTTAGAIVSLVSLVLINPLGMGGFVGIVLSAIGLSREEDNSKWVGIFGIVAGVLATVWAWGWLL